MAAYIATYPTTPITSNTQKRRKVRELIPAIPGMRVRTKEMSRAPVTE